MALVPYPDQFPSEAFVMVLDKVRGKSEATVGDLVHAGWNVAGFAAKQTLGGGPFAGSENGELDVAGWEDSDVLQAAVDQHNGAKMGIIPWAIVLKIAIKVITAAVL